MNDDDLIAILEGLTARIEAIDARQQVTDAQQQVMMDGLASLAEVAVTIFRAVSPKGTLPDEVVNAGVFREAITRNTSVVSRGKTDAPATLDAVVKSGVGQVDLAIAMLEKHKDAPTMAQTVRIYRARHALVKARAELVDRDRGRDLGR